MTEPVKPQKKLVVHCKREKFDSYIGRPAKNQPWGFGNPFRMPKYSREDCIKHFKQWLVFGYTQGEKDATPERREWILRHVHELKDLVLGCWCNPQECHGDFLVLLTNTPTNVQRLIDKIDADKPTQQITPV